MHEYGYYHLHPAVALRKAFVQASHPLPFCLQAFVKPTPIKLTRRLPMQLIDKTRKSIKRNIPSLSFQVHRRLRLVEGPTRVPFRDRGPRNGRGPPTLQ